MRKKTNFDSEANLRLSKNNPGSLKKSGALKCTKTQTSHVKN